MKDGRVEGIALALGNDDGEMDGIILRTDEGVDDGVLLGDTDGDVLGTALGATLGVNDGKPDSNTLGMKLGWTMLKTRIAPGCAALLSSSPSTSLQSLLETCCCTYSTQSVTAMG